MTKSRTFGSGAPVGVPHMDLNIYGETFKVRGKMSGVRLLHVMSAMDGNTDHVGSAEVSITKTITDFLRDAFLTEDRKRGMDFLEHSDPPVDLPLLLEIIQWLIGEYTGNPTEQPAPSSAGSESGGSGSLESAPQGAAVTYVPSTESSSSL